MVPRTLGIAGGRRRGKREVEKEERRKGREEKKEKERRREYGRSWQNPRFFFNFWIHLF